MQTPVTIALDAMGGDRAPAEPVRGAIMAATDGIRILLVGDGNVLRTELAAQGGSDGVQIVHAPDRIDSSEDGAKAVRAKPESSLVVAFKLVADGSAQAVMSPGNTGASLAAATLHLRRLPGVIRPGIAVVLPSARGPVVLIDAGANHEARAEYLQQFAVMGRLLSRDVLQVAAPRVGLLSIGEEEGKGSELVQSAYAALEGSDGFVGNCEGRDIPEGLVDVVVTDGFTGNVALKLYEAAGTVMFREIRDALQSSVRGRAGGVLATPALRRLRKKFDADEYGGAYLLGVGGLVVIGHGNASGYAIANAIRMGARGVREGLVSRVQAGLDSSDRRSVHKWRRRGGA
jgi:glycerol-3-phosphate acyltransferase PlsX